MTRSALLVPLIGRRNAPGRVYSVFARVVEAYPVPIPIAQVRFSPKPGLILRSALECDSHFLEALNTGIEVVAFKIDNDIGRLGEAVRMMNRKRCAAIRTTEPRILRQILDYKYQAQPSVEQYRGCYIRRRNCNLIQIHLTLTGVLLKSR